MQIAMSIPTQPVLDYARPLPILRTRQTRWGTAGCVIAALTAAYTIACTIGLFRATGWDQLGWLVVGFYGNWIGAGFAALFGIIGCFRGQRLRIRAVKAICAAAVVAGAPLAAILVSVWVSKHL